MAAALRINPRFPLPRNPLAALSSAAAAAETNPPHLAAGSPETTETPPFPPPDPAGSPSPRKALDKLKSAIRSESDPDRLAALFESAAQHKHFHSDPRFYPLTVQKLVRARRPDLIKRLLNNSTSDPTIPQSDGFIARIMKLYSTASMPGQAISTFDRAVSAGQPLAERSLCALLSAFLKAGELDRAVEAFNNIPKQLNLTPGLGAHNILLQILCKKGDFAAARKLLDEMCDTDCAKPDIISYTTDCAKPDIISYTTDCAKPRSHPHAEGSLCALLAERSLCALLAEFLKAGELDRAVEAFDNIPKQLNITPGLGAHNILLQILCKKGDFAAARKLLDEMSNTDCAKPNIISYTTVLNGYLWKDDEAGFNEILDEINRAGLVDYSVGTYNCRITFFCRKKEMAKAEEVLDEMVAKWVTPNRASFKKLIAGFYKVDDMGSALRVFKRMKREESTAANTYNMLIGYLLGKGDWESYLRVLKRMKREESMNNLVPDANTYNMLIGGLVRKGEFGSALEVCNWL